MGKLLKRYMKTVLVVCGENQQFFSFVSERSTSGERVTRTSTFEIVIEGVRYVNVPPDKNFYLVRAIRNYDVAFYGTYYLRRDWEELLSNLNAGLYRQNKELLNPKLNIVMQKMLDIPQSPDTETRKIW
jgi:hypothetical protein